MPPQPYHLYTTILSDPNLPPIQPPVCSLHQPPASPTSCESSQSVSLRVCILLVVPMMQLAKHRFSSPYPSPQLFPTATTIARLHTSDLFTGRRAKLNHDVSGHVGPVHWSSGFSLCTSHGVSVGHVVPMYQSRVFMGHVILVHQSRGSEGHVVPIYHLVGHVIPVYTSLPVTWFLYTSHVIPLLTILLYTARDFDWNENQDQHLMSMVQLSPTRE